MTKTRWKAKNFEGKKKGGGLRKPAPKENLHKVQKAEEWRET